MSLQYSPTLVADLNKKFLLVDTTVLINASFSDDFLSLLTRLVEEGCSLVTIPSVVYEFTRNADSIASYNERQEFITNLKIAVLNRIEEVIEDNVFKIAYSKAFIKRQGRKGPSYTDALLCTTAYKYRNADLLLMTANHNDIPLSMFDRTELITIDTGKELRNEAIYKLSSSKLSGIIKSIQ